MFNKLIEKLPPSSIINQEYSLGCGKKSLAKLFADIIQNRDDPADRCASNQMCAQMLFDEPHAHVWS